MSNDFSSKEQRFSYGIGRQLGDQLASGGLQEVLDFDALNAGLRDAVEGKELAVDPELLQAAFQEMNEVLQAQKNEQAEVMSAAGTEFLAENAKRDGVVVTDSGLQYEVINAGEGDKPSASSTVRTHYHGTLIDGTVFDSSYDRGEPAEFPVNGVISGWTEALQLMGVGSKWRLYLPYNLAYGEQGAGGQIGPYATLIFDVELLDIIA